MRIYSCVIVQKQPRKHESTKKTGATRNRPLSNGVGLWVLCAALVLEGCGRQSAALAPTPAPDPTLLVTPLESVGPIRIGFVNASIAPGSTVAGCGTLIEGCAGRLRMTFLLNPSSDGPVLYARLYLHATNLQACLWGEIAPFTVRTGTPLTIEIPTDRPDNSGCVNFANPKSTNTTRSFGATLILPGLISR